MRPNDSAFPRDVSDERDHQGRMIHGAFQAPGLTKREYFASKALQSILVIDGKQSYETCAKYAVAVADELIRALNEKESSQP